MSIKLTDSQVQLPAGRKIQANCGHIGDWQIFDWRGGLLHTKGVLTTDSTVLRLREAREANTGKGSADQLHGGAGDYTGELHYTKVKGPGSTQDLLITRYASATDI